MLGTMALLAAFWLGWRIGDAGSLDRTVQGRVTLHLLWGLGALCGCVFVHAIVLTYFLGTGRWLEETARAYHLSDEWQQQSYHLKWRLYPWMLLAILWLIVTGAFGAAADPASAVGFTGFAGLSAAQVHLSVAVGALTFNGVVSIIEYRALARNAALVAAVLAEVRRIRLAKGLEV